MLDERLQHLDEIRQIKKRRLRVLEKMAAVQGIQADPSILLEIEALQRDISLVEEQLSVPNESIEGQKPPQTQVKDTQQIEIVLNLKLADFSPEVENAAIRALAAIMDIPIDQIRIVKVTSGSTKIIIEIQGGDAEQLLAAFLNKDPQLSSLGVSNIQLKTDTDQLVNSLDDIPDLPVGDDMLGAIRADVLRFLTKSSMNASIFMDLIDYISDDLEDLLQEAEHQRVLRKERQRRLRALEVEKAKKGSNTEPETITEIDDLKKLISENNVRIKILAYCVAKIKSISG